MFLLLAEIKIPDVHSAWSMLSIVGIIYFLFCFYQFKDGTAKGIITNCGFLSVGIIFLIVVGTENDGTGMFSKRFVDKNDRNLTISEVEYFERDKLSSQEKLEIYKNTDTPFISPDDDFTAIWAMNDKNSEYYLCSSDIFHPACLFWCPVFFSLPVIIGGALISNRKGR